MVSSKGGRPHVLTVASHKGGTGKTTTVLALAHAFAQRGERVAIVTGPWAPETRVVVGESDVWGATRVHDLDEGDPGSLPADIVIADAPPLGARTAQRLLRRTDSVLLTCLPDPLSLRTLSVATDSIRETLSHRPSLRLLGLVLCAFDESNALHEQLVADLRSRASLLLEPLIPLDPAIRRWGLRPGDGPPPGAATDAYRTLMESLDLLESASPPGGVEQGAEGAVISRITWCDACGWSIPSHHVAGGLARRSPDGQLTCHDCLRRSRSRVAESPLSVG